MRLIQRHLRSPRYVSQGRIYVEASPELAWRAARHFDGASIPWVRMLFALRTGEHAPHVGVDPIANGEAPGFAVLEEDPGREVVIGAIGQFWHVAIPFAVVAPADFATFDESGWGKVAWAIRVEGFGGGSVISLEVRVTATDEESWRSFERYFTVIGPASEAIRSSVLAHLETELGAYERCPDSRRDLPGDGLLDGARYSLTHAIEIEAPPALVWPWLMQLGCDRAGWYSIDLLDHGGAPSFEHLVTSWATREVGEIVATTLAKDGGYEVMAVEQDHLYVIGGETDRLGGHVAMTWAFVLEPIGGDATRLLTRVRARGTPRWSEWLQGRIIFPPVHAIMQHAQLAKLKRLAEREALAR